MSIKLKDSIYQRKQYEAINGLRAFSAIGIVLMHVLANGNYSVDGFLFEKLIPSFTNFVFLFMIISGFAMCCGYYDKIINSEISLKEFYGKRYYKVWPFFAILCILDLIVSPSINSLYEVFVNLTLCFGLLPNANISVIGVGWFLGLVFVFYMVFPFFCYLISEKKRAWLSFVAAVMFNLLCSNYFGIGRTNIMYSAMFFFAGGMIFVYREQLELFSKKYSYFVLLLCAVATVGYYLFDVNVLLILLVVSLYLVYAIGNTRVGLLRNPITKFLSGISMEVYLSHMAIYRVIEKVGLSHIFGKGVLSYVLTSIGTLIGVLAFAVVAQWGLNKLSDLISNKRK